MAVRTTLGRCLLVRVAMGLVAQALALSIHPPAEVVASAPDEEGGRGDHESSACDLCQVLSQVRAQTPPAAPHVVPLLDFGRGAPRAVPGLLAAGPEPSAASPRAPPLTSIS